MIYFTQDFLDFFEELEHNNDRDWFASNRKRYETSVRNPFKTFVTDLIERISQHEPLEVEAKNCIFRINRDIRFTKDKTPYKLHASAAIAPYGKKDFDHPGIFFQFSHRYLQIGGGLYKLQKEQLYKVRQHIQYNIEEFEKLINDPDFVDTCGQIIGEKNKIIAKEFKEDANTYPILYHKQFYFWKEYNPSQIVEDHIMDFVESHYLATQKLHNFYLEALS